MFDLENAIDLNNMELNHAMPATYDRIRKAIKDGKRSIVFSEGYCGRHDCVCVGSIPETHLDKLRKDKYNVNEVQLQTYQFGDNPKKHFAVSGWSQTKRKYIRAVVHAS